MVETTTLERFETLTNTMKAKLRLVADYMGKEMESFAIMELEALDKYLDAQMNNIREIIPDARQING